MRVAVNAGGTLFFYADNATTGRELWKSDGTPAGTVLVKDIIPGANASGPTYFTAYGGVAHFTANDGVLGTELWRSDGGPGGTFLVHDVGPGDSSPSTPDADGPFTLLLRL